MSAEQESDSDLVAQLLRAAGRREEPPADAYRQTLDAATIAWRRTVRGRKRQRFIGWAAAACVVAAVAVGLLIHGIRPNGAAIVARVERVIGAAEARGARDARWMPVNDRSPPLVQGAFLRTDKSGLAGVLLSGGASLRLAERTEISFDSESRVHLFAGRVYLDNGGSSGSAQRIEIETPAGVASDVGTQFEVQYVDAAYRVRVREGRVYIRRGAEAIESAAGEEISIDAAGTVTRERIARDHQDWRWVETLSPAPDLEGQPVSTLLAWVARETGRAVKFEPPEIEQKARSTILHGDIGALAPLEALEVMLETTDLAHTVLEDGTIVIRSRGT
ncbi:MAG: FecR domain-containing protein [Steroidobacteraceae bacterium]